MKRGMLLLSCCLLLSGCGNYGQLQPMEEPEWKIQEEAVVTFSDGETVDCWVETYSWGTAWGYYYYKLSDGTELLREEQDNGPENVYVMNHESWQDLGETAREAVSAYYEEQGLLYDVEEELEKAYGDYLACQESGTEFQSWLVGQSVSPMASNEELFSFLTVVTLPQGGGIVDELRLGTIFDRETGAVVSPWDLFSVSEEEAREALLDQVSKWEPELRQEMAAAMKPEYLLWQDDHLELWFPAGSLPGEAYAWGTGIDYTELEDVLHDWAVPAPYAGKA